MPSQNVPITPPRVPLIDARTKNVSREWYMFFLSLYNISQDDAAITEDFEISPFDNNESQIAELEKRVQSLEVALSTAPRFPLIGELANLNAASPSDGDKLIYNATTGRWDADERSYLMLE